MQIDQTQQCSTWYFIQIAIIIMIIKSVLIIKFTKQAQKPTAMNTTDDRNLNNNFGSGRGAGPANYSREEEQNRIPATEVSLQRRKRALLESNADADQKKKKIKLTTTTTAGASSASSCTFSGNHGSPFPTAEQHRHYAVLADAGFFQPIDEAAAN